MIALTHRYWPVLFPFLGGTNCNECHVKHSIKRGTDQDDWRTQEALEGCFFMGGRLEGPYWQHRVVELTGALLFAYPNNTAQPKTVLDSKDIDEMLLIE